MQVGASTWCKNREQRHGSNHNASELTATIDNDLNCFDEHPVVFRNSVGVVPSPISDVVYVLIQFTVARICQFR